MAIVMHRGPELPVVGDLLLWILAETEPMPSGATLMPELSQGGFRCCWRTCHQSGPQGWPEPTFFARPVGPGEDIDWTRIG